MAAIMQEEAPPVPNWLLKLEEQRAKRLRAKLGHEAGAGAPCQICGAKCPGLDLHFWRKICKICKCGKEDHDISDEDIYGFVQFTLLGSKPVKTKGILLKGSNDEVILEFTPKGSSNDVKKYLDELPEDLLAVKGSEAAKLRKQRLQKQMPAHDIDPTLCHALTDEEIKQLEEYVAFIRKHSVGQGSIIRIPLYKGAQHTLNKTNAKLITQTIPNQIASNQTVLLQPADLANNLQNLTIQNTEKTLPNYAPNQTHQIVDNQSPIGAAAPKITDVKYPLLEIHPLTTSNVERHQEQYENPNYEINNANLSYNTAPNMGYIPSFLNPVEEHQNPVNATLTKDLKYPVNYANSPRLNDEIPPPINEKTHPKYNDQNINVGASGRIKPLQPNSLIDPVNDRQVPSFGGYIKDLNYPTNTANQPKTPVLRAQNIINPMETHQNASSVGPLQDYPMGRLDDNNSNYPTNSTNQLKIPILRAQNTLNPVESQQNPAVVDYSMGRLDDNNSNYPTNNTNQQKIPVLRAQNTINPLESQQNPAIVDYSMGRLDDNNSNYPTNSSNQQKMPVLRAQNNINPVESHQNPASVGPLHDLINRRGHLDDTNSNVNYPTNSTNQPKMPVLQAQSLINPMETHQNLSSVGLLKDLNYAMGHQEDTNSNVAALKCHECAEIFADGSVAVSAERTTNIWHAKCFNCHTCKQPLADLLYFYHKETDNIYCGRDYAILKGIPRCAACDELIFVREYCLAEGSTFHVKHFCCFECDQPLAGKSYLMENNQPVCLECFENLKAEICRDCLKVIRPEEQGVCLQDLHWHATDNCFVCKKCRKPLLGQKLLLRHENLFCSDFCYKNY